MYEPFGKLVKSHPLDNGAAAACGSFFAIRDKWIEQTVELRGVDLVEVVDEGLLGVVGVADEAEAVQVSPPHPAPSHPTPPHPTDPSTNYPANSQIFVGIAGDAATAGSYLDKVVMQSDNSVARIHLTPAGVQARSGLLAAAIDGDEDSKLLEVANVMVTYFYDATPMHNRADSHGQMWAGCVHLLVLVDPHQLTMAITTLERDALSSPPPSPPPFSPGTI